VLAGVVVVLAAGCSRGPGAETRPSYDPAGIAQAALDALDKNKNGALERAELDACPALLHALPAIDRNQDKALSRDELRQRAEQYATLGRVAVTCVVTLDGAPLVGATVTFEPEPWLGPGLKPATAKTDPEGVTGTWTIDGQPAGDLPRGLYRIRITKDGANIPPRYNVQTTLGREVFSVPRQGDLSIELALRSR
jgi:hypothetical protein